jgi:hypothetical protein
VLSVAFFVFGNSVHEFANAFRERWTLPRRKLAVVSSRKPFVREECGLTRDQERYRSQPNHNYAKRVDGVEATHIIMCQVRLQTS